MIGSTLNTTMRESSRWLRQAVGRATRSARTIRGRILVAFIVMSVITAALGGYATLQIRQAGILVTKTYDQSLMSIDYARAAAADFAAMRAVFARRWVVRDPAERQALDSTFETLRQSLFEDLSIAAERSQSVRAEKAAAGARRSITEWDALRNQHGADIGLDSAWKTLDAQATAADQQIDLLVNYTAGDGFIYRQSARAIVSADIETNLICTGLALLIAGLVAWQLMRRIIGPVALASKAAREIADGKLDCIIPHGGSDELGALLLAMGVMRDNLRIMMEREVAQRRSAQTRLADAIESSREGIVVVDAAGRVAHANTQFAHFLSLAPEDLRPGTPVAALTEAIDMPATESRPMAAGAGGLPSLREAQLADGRWLRISRSATQESGFVAVLSDITEQKNQEATLTATNLRLDAALDNMSQGLCLYDADSRLQVVNRRFLELFHLDPADVTPGLAYADVLALKIAAGNYGEPMSAGLLRDRMAQVERQAAGLIFEELARGRTVAIAHQPMAGGGRVVTYEDVTERRRAEAEIVFMAHHDALTRLPNRLLFAERTEQALASVARGGSFAVLCLDLDHFKQVNDTLGHPAGDELLRIVAGRLQACVREGDTVARLGGDEFAVVQCCVERPEDTTALAQRIVETVSAPMELNMHALSIGVSIGISVAPTDGMSSERLLKNADAALYRAKADGRGTWRCFEPAMDARLQARRALERDLREALVEEQFELYYQPLYDLALNRICGFEALLRWNHPTRGQVNPSDFIPVAEEIGFIAPLGEWVLRTACAEARHWPPYIKVAVNVSPAQFKSGRLVLAITEALTLAGLTPNRLELEITETVLLADSAATLDTLHALRDSGVRVSMDDFGTGYSSLSYLRSFPFDKIKIDQSFIRDLTTKDDSGVIVRAITRLGSSLGMRTTAEGVESYEQLARLRVEGCNEVQGYYFSRPAPVRDIPALLARWSDAGTAAA